jgi:monomeric phenylalanine-4-hydroxylase
VPGLIPEVPFFSLLAQRKFPVTDWIRRPEEFDYIVEPDIFHDMFGHVPLLFNPVFADYVQRYGQGGLKAHGLGACEQLSRLYWYTIEFGLIRQAEGLRAYGAGILSSAGELRHAVHSPEPRRVDLQLDRTMRTRYKIDSYQQTYFVIDTFQQLFDMTAPDFAPVYERIRGLPELAADAAGPLARRPHLLNLGEIVPFSGPAATTTLIAAYSRANLGLRRLFPLSTIRSKEHTYGLLFMKEHDIYVGSLQEKLNLQVCTIHGHQGVARRAGRNGGPAKGVRDLQGRPQLCHQHCRAKPHRPVERRHQEPVPTLPEQPAQGEVQCHRARAATPPWWKPSSRTWPPRSRSRSTSSLHDLTASKDSNRVVITENARPLFYMKHDYLVISLPLALDTQS